MPTLAKTIFELGRIYNCLNQKLFNGELESPLITVQSKGKRPVLGWCTSRQVWKQTKDGEKTYYEINISAEYISRCTEDIVHTMLHEMVHLYAAMKGIKDTSRSGTYHNEKYRDLAIKHGLAVEKDDKYGWTLTSLTESTLEIVKEIKANKYAFGIYRQDTAPTGPGKKKKSSTRKYICPTCQTSVRATKDVNIACLDCKAVMQKEQDEDENDEFNERIAS
jgi:ferredoxin-thioredoxin reductase catalytic subunit